MSRVGKAPVTVPDKVKVSFAGGVFEATGPVGTEKVAVNPHIDVKITGNTIEVINKTNASNLHGLTRALIYNAVTGVAAGYEKKLEIVGVGYRAESKGSVLKLTLGFSHQVDYPIPQGIKIDVQDQTKVTIKGSNRELVGRVADQIRRYRMPEPYKGKGIKYANEVIIRKVGKAAGGK